MSSKKSYTARFTQYNSQVCNQSRLHLAAWNGDLKQVHQLISKGSNVNAIRIHPPCSTPLNFCAWNGHLQVAEYLLQNGADPNIQNERGFTPLNSAIWRQHKDLAFLLIQHGADINLQSNEGYTPLMTACIKSSRQTVAMLLEYGADVNLVSDSGWSALKAAVGHSDFAVLELVIQYGVDVQCGARALENARRRGLIRQVQFLEAWGLMEEEPIGVAVDEEEPSEQNIKVLQEGAVGEGRK